MTQARHVIDVDASSFSALVAEESFRRPVAVDFWAAWCGPCRALGPILERLAEEFAGAFLLAKVDTEANQDLAASFRIRSIPNVKIFRNGAVVDEMNGAFPEHEARRFLRRHCPSGADKKYTEGRAALEDGRADTARAAFDAALAVDPAHAGTLIELGRLSLAEGNLADADSLWSRIPASSPQWNEAQSLRSSLEFAVHCQEAGGPEEASRRAAASSSDLEARYGHACCLAADRDYRGALGELLSVVARDKNFRDQRARKAMLTIFTLVGERSALAEEYRKRLAQVLF